MIISRYDFHPELLPIFSSLRALVLAMRLIWLTLFLVFCHSSLVAQVDPGFSNPMRTSVWHFGLYAGLDFSSGTLQQKPDSPVDFQQNNGTSMSDTLGNLLYYVAAPEVYGPNHQLMAGSPVKASLSDVRRHVITIPKPGSETEFYVFWLHPYEIDGDPNRKLHRLEYLTIDMAANGGSGAVSGPPVTIDAGLSRVFTLVQHCDGESVWLLTHHSETSAFRARRCGAQGPEPHFVATPTNIPFYYSSIKWSNMRPSPDGSLLVIPGIESNSMAAPDYRSTLATFDIRTGKVGESIRIRPHFSDACFSPDNTKLYLCANDKHIYQYSVEQLDEAVVATSEVDLYVAQFGSVRWWEYMQLSPEGKIYMTSLNDDDMGVINFPNVAGPACDLQDRQIDLGSTPFGFGMMGNALINFPQYYFDKGEPLEAEVMADFTFQQEHYCTLQDIPFVNTSDSNAHYYSWTVTELASGENEFHDTEDLIHHFGRPGTYQVSLAVEDACRIARDTVTQEITIKECGVTIPNVFSPNGDGINDAFLPLFEFNLSSYQLEIYDRWGNLLFRTSSATEGWTGDNAPEGAYYFLIQYRKEGHLTPVLTKESGYLTLVR